MPETASEPIYLTARQVADLVRVVAPNPAVDPDLVVDQEGRVATRAR